MLQTSFGVYLDKPQIPHFPLLSKSQSMYHLVWEKDENEIGEVNGGRCPERNQLDLFKSAGFEESYYVVVENCVRNVLTCFFLSRFLSLRAEPIVIIITSLDLLSSLTCRRGGNLSSLSLEMDQAEEQAVPVWRA